MTGPRRTVAAASLLLGAVALLAGGVALGAKPAPAAAPPPPPAPIRFLTADSVSLSGQWFAGPRGAAIVVLAPRRRGPDTELAAVAEEFRRHGFSALTFALRDSLRADRERDSLRYVVLASHWVDDMVAALKAARTRGDSTTHVYAWGQGLGGVLAISAAARVVGLCEALAAEDIFPSVDYAMRLNGTAVIPDAVKAQMKVVRGGDEPFSAAARLNLPVYAILVGSGAGDFGDVVHQAFRRNRGRTDHWLRPGVASPAPTPGPAQVDTLSAWFQRWNAYARAR